MNGANYATVSRNQHLPQCMNSLPTKRKERKIRRDEKGMEKKGREEKRKEEKIYLIFG